MRNTIFPYFSAQLLQKQYYIKFQYYKDSIIGRVNATFKLT